MTGTSFEYEMSVGDVDARYECTRSAQDQPVLDPIAEPLSRAVRGAYELADQCGLNKDWDGDVKAFDAVHDLILHMSDALSDGIVKQIPDKFGAGVVSTTGR